MFPIVLDLKYLQIALVGGGKQALRRLKILDETGARYVRVFADNFGKEFWDAASERMVTRMPNDDEIKQMSAILIVDVEDSVAESIVKRAREFGVLVHVEDKRELCDFFCPSVVRSGDLLVTVSTGGQSPTLAKRIRNIIGMIFNDVWKKRVDDIGEMRRKWRDIGLDMNEVEHMSNKYIDEQGWLEYEELMQVKERVE